MRMLILGGTVFLGRALVDAATAQGHDVTTLSRGRSGLDPEGVEVLRGDRDQADGLRALEGRTFDVVVDTCRQAVSQVRAATAELEARTGRYVFISTISVYRDFSEVGITEESPTVEPLWPESAAQEDDLENYPSLNVACEQALVETLGDRALVVRPGLIVGDHDRSDRFGYWPGRMTRGGDVLAPGAPDRPVQFIDVRDLAEFVVAAAAAERSGIYHATGPALEMTMGDFLRSCQDHVGNTSPLVWVDDDFLTARGVPPYVGLPLWIPDSPEDQGFSRVDNGKAVAAGLTYRPLEDTIAAALRTERRVGLDRERRAGLTPARERELITEWRSGPR
jgi:2'-hydroxyisoflavone reductase